MNGKVETINGNKVKSIAGFVIFAIIIVNIFVRLTYLFRNSEDAEHTRETITGFADEKDIDVVLIGASSTNEYFQPLTAWNEYGFTSYDYTTSESQFELYRFYMDEVLRTHNPKVFVIDITMIGAGEEINHRLRYWTDSLGLFSLNRYRSLNYYLLSRPEGDDATYSYYIDFAKYHSNHTALGQESNWGYIDNHGRARDKGYVMETVNETLPEPLRDNIQVGVLNERTIKAMDEMFAYIEEKNLNAIFVKSPSGISNDSVAQYMAAKQYIEAAGHECIVFDENNQNYENIGLDFNKDFRNALHVNTIGALKYTRYFSAYLKDHYELPDRRKDPEYAEWNNFYDTFRAEAEESIRDIEDIIVRKKMSNENGRKLRNMTNLYEWSIAIKDSNFCLMFMENGNISCEDAIDEKVLEDWNMVDGVSNVIKVYMGNDLICPVEGKMEEPVTKTFPGHTWGPTSYVIENCEAPKITIGESVYENLTPGSLSVLVYDCNYDMVLDFVNISINSRGKLEMSR